MPNYIGRFAPSPTGPLHFGSLLTALASWCDARAANGQWLLRIEDVDVVRTQLGAAEQIIRTLEHYGLWWDGEIIYQSQRTECYQAALQQLQQQNDIFWCTCSRADLAQTQSDIYTGHCRAHHQYRSQAAARLRVYKSIVDFDDGVFGHISESVADTVGDFVIFRRDGLFAYHLAVVVDDAEQGITNIVRGADLLNNTSRQIYLQQRLAVTTPAYTHIPLVVNDNGEKLSKQTGARALTWDNPSHCLWQALTLLGQHAPDVLQSEDCATLLTWAINHWQRENIPKRLTL
ncbi:MAG: tRNA glutamyl-Q(34) synthetase GluQRS [Agitococcus sp.]|nr:tRNA glutamyl-Q(34) synthetase GluQRS [Agitococcus sp.]